MSRKNQKSSTSLSKTKTVLIKIRGSWWGESSEEKSLYTPPFFGSYQSFYNHPSSSLCNYTTLKRKIKARHSHPKIIQQTNPRFNGFFSPRTPRKRARTLATFATRKLLALLVGQPDAFGAGEFARHMRRRAKLGGKSRRPKVERTSEAKWPQGNAKGSTKFRLALFDHYTIAYSVLYFEPWRTCRYNVERAFF